MNYTKPEVAVLGDAERVIERTTGLKHNGNVTDGVKALINAYDLDE